MDIWYKSLLSPILYLYVVSSMLILLTFFVIAHVNCTKLFHLNLGLCFIGIMRSVVLGKKFKNRDNQYYRFDI